jgi:hypothetical protein
MGKFLQRIKTIGDFISPWRSIAWAIGSATVGIFMILSYARDWFFPVFAFAAVGVLYLWSVFHIIYAIAVKKVSASGAELSVSPRETARNRRIPARGTSLYLLDLPAQEVRILGEKLQCSRLLAGDKPTHSLDAHPTEISLSVFGSSVTYELPSGFRHLYGAAGIADIYQARSKGVKTDKTNSPLVFEIHGDGKLLWKSRKLQNSPELEFFQVDVSAVKVLRLKVDCCLPNNGCAWAVWVEPHLAP